MRHTEKLVLTHSSGDKLYPVMMENKATGKVAYRVVPPGGDKTEDLYETEDAEEAIQLVLKNNFSIRCETLTPSVKQKNGKSIKRSGLYSLNGTSIISFTTQ
ncbi:transposase [Cronobacter dublinensis]|nr:transposase [Cronobacter dublinensis]EKF2281418.1 transposase [Cronobacter dublinensis]EKF2293157.1 transposase [Cronobacter dublinensis]EKF2294700.1 transposase [Cronobacter dublinensis]EKF2296967.1 transposase [Cronobacter dublinensis]